MKRVSVTDVARDAGVSLGTVSNVFNNPDRVRPETRARVEASVQKLGFVRNEQARALKSGSSTTVAYVMLSAANPFFTDIAAGMDPVLREAKLTLFLCDSRLDASLEDDYLEQLLKRRAKGVMVTGVNYDNPRLDLLRTSGVPVVIIDRPPSGTREWCSATVDDDEGGYLAAHHLVEQGHRSLGFAGGPLSMPQVRQRLLGAERAVHDAGAELAIFETPRMTIDDGLQLGAHLCQQPASERPTGVFCANDLLALGLLQAAIQGGLQVPDDLAIIGYDDIVYARAAAVPLSSIAQPSAEIGRAAAELMLTESREGTHHEHQERVFRPTLVARASTLRAAG